MLALGQATSRAVLAASSARHNTARACATLGRVFSVDRVRLGIARWLLRSSAKSQRSSYGIRALIDDIETSLVDRTIVMQRVDCRRIASDRLVYVDIGARGGLPPDLSPFSSLLSPVFFEPDAEECQRLTTLLPNATVIGTAIGDRNGQATLFLTKKRACSSLLKPDGHMINLLSESLRADGTAHGSIERFTVEREVNVNVKTLTEALSGVVSEIDLMKVDVQGLEFEVLNTLGSFRPFGAVIECSSTELYVDQKSLFEVGATMRKLGYFPLTLLPPHPIERTDKRSFKKTLPLHGDMIFVPDNSPEGRAIITRDPLKWVVTLGILGHLDFAEWQAKEIGIEIEALR